MSEKKTKWRARSWEPWGRKEVLGIAVMKVRSRKPLAWRYHELSMGVIIAKHWMGVIIAKHWSESRLAGAVEVKSKIVGSSGDGQQGNEGGSSCRQ